VYFALLPHSPMPLMCPCGSDFSVPPVLDFAGLPLLRGVNWSWQQTVSWAEARIRERRLQRCLLDARDNGNLLPGAHGTIGHRRQHPT